MIEIMAPWRTKESERIKNEVNNSIAGTNTTTYGAIDEGTPYTMKDRRFFSKSKILVTAAVMKIHDKIMRRNNNV